MTTWTTAATITFGDQAENHVGMQKIGSLRPSGFTLEDLVRTQVWFQERNVKCVIYDIRQGCLDLNQLPIKTVEPAYILVARRGLDVLLERTHQRADAFYHEHDRLDKDTRALMYGRVCNKKARWNLCFAPYAQEPDYVTGKGRVVAFGTMPLLNHVRERLPEIFGEKTRDLMAEANYYHDPAECGIGFHGDAERRLVIGIRLGVALPLQYQWYYDKKPIGRRAQLILGHGDVYVMSEKAVGTDWKRSKVLTLRHAAGAPKFLK